MPTFWHTSTNTNRNTGTGSMDPIVPASTSTNADLSISRVISRCSSSVAALHSLPIDGRYSPACISCGLFGSTRADNQLCRDCCDVRYSLSSITRSRYSCLIRRSFSCICSRSRSRCDTGQSPKTHRSALFDRARAADLHAACGLPGIYRTIPGQRAPDGMRSTLYFALPATRVARWF